MHALLKVNSIIHLVALSTTFLQRAFFIALAKYNNKHYIVAVSYTHLTLPTIYSV